MRHIASVVPRTAKTHLSVKVGTVQIHLSSCILMNKGRYLVSQIVKLAEIYDIWLPTNRAHALCCTPPKCLTQTRRVLTTKIDNLMPKVYIFKQPDKWSSHKPTATHIFHTIKKLLKFENKKKLPLLPNPCSLCCRVCPIPPKPPWNLPYGRWPDLCHARRPGSDISVKEQHSHKKWMEIWKLWKTEWSFS